MKATELRDHKQAFKRLGADIVFKSVKKDSPPKPLNKLSGSRIKCTDLLAVSSTHKVVMYGRDGELRTDSAFYAYLFCESEDKKLLPLLEFHFHPSHKGVHAKLPCETEPSYVGRRLVQAPELSVTRFCKLDPRLELDRAQLIENFCKVCGINMNREGDLWSS